MIEKTVPTGLMQPGEEKTFRVEWGLTIPYDYIPWWSTTEGINIESTEPDANGITLMISAVPYPHPVEGVITCRAYSIDETETKQPCPQL